MSTLDSQPPTFTAKAGYVHEARATSCGLIVATRWHPAHVVCLPAPFAWPLPSQLRRMPKMLMLFLIGRGGGGPQRERDGVASLSPAAPVLARSQLFGLLRSLELARVLCPTSSRFLPSPSLQRKLRSPLRESTARREGRASPSPQLCALRSPPTTKDQVALASADHEEGAGGEKEAAGVATIVFDWSGERGELIGGSGG